MVLAWMKDVWASDPELAIFSICWLSFCGFALWRVLREN